MQSTNGSEVKYLESDHEYSFQTAYHVSKLYLQSREYLGPHTLTKEILLPCHFRMIVGKVT